MNGRKTEGDAGLGRVGGGSSEGVSGRVGIFYLNAK